MAKLNTKRLYRRAMFTIISLVMVLSYIERLYLVCILMAFLLLMFVKPVRQWVLTPDKF